MGQHSQTASSTELIKFANYLSYGATLLLNWQRGRTGEVDYVQINLPQNMPALPEQRSLIQRQLAGKPPMSLLELQRAFERIAADPRPRGVILGIRGFQMSFADLQTLRDSIRRFRRSGKRVVAYAQEYDMRTYYVASAADEIIMQPGGSLLTLGLLQQRLFLKDALDTVGLQAEVVAISPYKSAADAISRSEPSPQTEEMDNWLLDSFFSQFVDGIAEGRGMPADEVRAMIDSAPHTDQAALARDYVDALATEEELRGHLGVEHIVLWEDADKIVRLKWRRFPEKYVAVLRTGGVIVPGESRRPPVDVPLPLVGAERMGDQTVVRQIRGLMKDKRAAAVVLFIESPGGSATASEAITAALAELAKDRPLVVCMNGTAASGGYYIATPAQWIVAQPGTITGSIGVVTAKLVNSEALRKLRFNAVQYMRGANAGIFGSLDPYTEQQREQVTALITRIYEQFLDRVGDSRKMKRDTVDGIGGGRVWTGAQALERGLVDQLGGLHEAVAKARELADLPDSTPLGIVGTPKKPLPAQLAQDLNPAAGLRYWQHNLLHIASGRPQMLMPFEWHW